MARSTSLTPEQMSLRGKIAAHSRWSQGEDRKAATAAARDAWFGRFLREVDPNETLPKRERFELARHAMTAHMARLALKSSKARSKTGDAA